ncbi:uncharacterized membrane protein DDB_G0293934 isoform X2 [Condylostylus longicornis]|nr:uncharacterized membrane protein DDB_G0293934 isoform X2 [Condylostylus longicornis]XP_055374099.1 uncharacterized membrane protein DDB_G0293934 isoform X2 [Condylostylus longicornis]XP_055374100.1 uncharacterized membrane protein DDB_G0293934 isoform X2 [Condylostylus longicornis]
MANIEVSLSSSANSGRRRKGSSLGSPSIINGNGSTRASPRPGETKELRSALQDREAVIQNLRIQLGLGKLPRPTGPPLDDSEKPAAEQKIARLKIDAENKRIAIRNLKSALDKLDITDNIDIRIRQAELEYALGREELQLLSIVEEARALQTRLDKSKPESNSLYSIITSGINLSLHAVNATTGRWAAITKSESHGLFIEWALDGEGLLRGDRILEVNGKLITCKTKEELQKIVGTSGKCQLVIIRKKSLALPQQQLAQQQEDNQRLQHRISYLEEQVRELQNAKETSPPPPLPSPSTHPSANAATVSKHNYNNKQSNNNNQNGNRSPVESITSSLSSMSSASSNNGCMQPTNATTTNGHVTSINISSPAALTPAATTTSTTTNTTNFSTPKSSTVNAAIDKPLVYQRGNYVTTLLGGKPIELTGNLSTINSNSLTKSTAATTSTKTTAINTKSDFNTPTSKTSSSQNIGNSNNNHSHHHHHHHRHHITKTLIHENGYSDRMNGSHTDTETSYMPSKSLSASKISINSDVPLSSQYQHHYHHHNQYNGSSSTGRKRYTERGLMRNGKITSEVANQIFNQQHHQQQNLINGINHINGLNNDIINGENMHARSVEHLNYNGIERRKDVIRSEQIRKFGNDLRSVKSLDFESDTNDGHLNHTSHIYSKRNVDYTSEPVAPRVRPTPPKKPLRLSLQRAQSLQTVEVFPGNDVDKKRPLKRAHNSEKANDQQIIENLSPLHTASLGRHKHI